ncbi:hypothetical protein SERLADRAFT_446715 [Serpula lacrymans var. lacrymans S7.9]|uniref:DUF803-domain-containing protein n=1 Tax=Serpula lacrymans var. lacrymans (strain S7.9) TaxID=578457 RepID=F8NMZ0_SERL9|nr:uncharacterized protein SERLADRAFT_446715 [Serpula lacrymans var. lacrymans S7.9]EGO27484.1 hypothetical protein SERLADRAFT_446715 [Serpula lacrymans var. lacrymans S7.9]
MTNSTKPDIDLGFDLPHLTLQTSIGISVAIAGNILISLALNVQKLAHRRLERERKKAKREGTNRARNDTARQGESGPASSDVELDNNPIVSDGFGDERNDDIEHSLLLENQPLLPTSSPLRPTYGMSAGSSASTDDRRSTTSSGSLSRGRRGARHQRKSSFSLHFIPFRMSFGKSQSQKINADAHMGPISVDEVGIHNGHGGFKRNQNAGQKKSAEEEENESDYLKSRLWWFGFSLMNIGELGNFISYAFAPASVVAPLGTFALMANCLVAPLMLGERFRKLDLLGILLAVIGATTVVLSTPSPDGTPPPLTPDALLVAISQRAFQVFCIVYLVGAVILGVLSEGAIGRKVVLVDIGLCAIFGGFTVLATKGVSTLLTKEWGKMFMEWICYPILAVLIITGILQVRYLNRALKRFDSKLVIPTHFVLFTLSAVIGSAVLYGDFKRATFHQMVTFLYGCGATFLGVFVIAWAPSGSGNEEGGTENGGDEGDGESAGGNVGVGSLRRRSRAALVPANKTRETPILRNKQSGMSLMGLSPAQHLLLIHTPPRDRPDYWERDEESRSAPGSVFGGR